MDSPSGRLVTLYTLYFLVFSRWFHTVKSSQERNLAVNLWFTHLLWFNQSDCEKNPPSDERVSLEKVYMSGMDESIEQLRWVGAGVSLAGSLETFYWTTEEYVHVGHYFGVKCAPCFCHFLHPKWCCTRLSFSAVVRNIICLLNLEFGLVWSSGSNFRAKTIFWGGPKSAKKWLSSANFSIFPYNSIEMSKN